MKKLLFLLFFTQSICFGAIKNYTPNTNGVFCSITDKDFDEMRYNNQIAHCKRNVNSSLKKYIYKTYNIDYSNRSNYTIDHIIPLSLGGNNSIENLWPQNKDIYSGNYERKLFDLVNNDKLSIKKAIQVIMLMKFNPKDNFERVLDIINRDY